MTTPTSTLAKVLARLPYVVGGGGLVASVALMSAGSGVGLVAGAGGVVASAAVLGAGMIGRAMR